MLSEIDSLIMNGLGEAATAAGGAFLLSRHTGEYFGVWRGEQASIDHLLDGHDTEASDAISTPKAPFTSAPQVGEIVIRKSDGETFTIVQVDQPDAVSYDLLLKQRNKES